MLPPPYMDRCCPYIDLNGENVVDLVNYSMVFGNREFSNWIFNNLLWLAVVLAACILCNLIIAFTDNIWWRSIAKSLIFLPLTLYLRRRQCHL